MAKAKPGYSPLAAASHTTVVSMVGTSRIDTMGHSRQWWPSEAMRRNTPHYSRPLGSSVEAASSISVMDRTDNAPVGDLLDLGIKDGDGEELKELTDILLGKHPPPALEDQTPAVSVVHLNKTDTSDSTQLNVLLQTLQTPTSGQQQQQQGPVAWRFSPQDSQLGFAPSAPAASAAVQQPVCVDATRNIVKDLVSKDTEIDDDDVPLISKRGLGMLSFGSPAKVDGVVANPLSADASMPFTSHAPAASTAATAQYAPFSYNQPQRSSTSPLAEVGAAFSASLSLFRPHPAWPQQADSLLYVAVFLTAESRDVLLGCIPPVHPSVSADHMTLAYKPSILQLLDYPLGAMVDLRVIAQAADSRAQAVVVDPPTWLPPTTSDSTHITISVAAGIKPVEAGQLVKDALFRMAVADPGSADPAAAGSYQHFDEALPLVGRLGVKLRKGPGCIVYSLEQLILAGLLTMDDGRLELYHRRHQDHLGGKDEVESNTHPGQFLAPCTALHSLPALLCTDQPPRGQDVKPPRDPYQAQLAGAGPAPAAQPGDAWASVLGSAGATCGFVCPAAAGRSRDTAAAAAFDAVHSSAVDRAVADQLLECSPPQQQQQQQSAMQLSPPGSPMAAAFGAAGEDDAGSHSSGSSSSGGDVVQFRSAVAAGDYVAVQPFVAAADGRQLMQGYVREFACDEPFQGNGVLVVLDDDTIGFVTAVLDSAMAASSSSSSSSSSSRKRHVASSKTKSSKGRGGKACRADKVAAAVAAGPLPGSPGGMSAAAAAAAAAAAVGFDDLTEWSLSALKGEWSTAAVGLGGRNAADAQKDLDLWHEFDTLQQRYGELLCSAILQECNQDFAEAISLIKAQQQPAAGSSMSASMEAAAAAAAAAAGAAAGGAGTSRPVAGGEVDEDDLLHQLALSLGLVPDSAVQLARLVPQLPADDVVQALQQHDGDVNRAADTLLSASGSSSSTAAAAMAAAPAAAGSPRSHAARVFLGSSDARLAEDVQTLCAMVPGLQQELAHLMLQEHNGNLREAADAILEMQADELTARSAAAAGVASPGQLVGPVVPPPAGSEELSEADQLAMLRAMGLLLDDSAAAKAAAAAAARTPQEVQQQQQLGLTTQDMAAGSSSSSSAAPARQHPHPGSLLHQQQGAGAGPGPAGPLGRHSYNHHLRQYQHQQQPAVDQYAEQEAKRAAKAAADKLFEKSRSLHAAAEVYMTVAQSLLKQGDPEGSREKRAAAQRVRAEAKAAADEAQRLSFAANNRNCQSFEQDYHGLQPPQAMCKFVKQFEALQALEHPGGLLFKVIVGQGHHSPDKVPKIKPKVLQYLQERADKVLQETGQPWAVTWEVDPGNVGVINVHIPQSSEGEAA